MNLFLLAAGLGTRLQPYTLQHPKPTIPFLNVPMGLYQFQYLRHLTSPITTSVVNTHHLPEQVEKLYLTQPYMRLSPYFSHENTILGSAGGLKLASAYMTSNQPILMMNADEVYFTQQKDFLNELLLEHKKSQALATLVVIKHPEAGKKFGAISCDGRLVKHISKTLISPNLVPWHYIGVMMISWSVLGLIPDHQETNIFYDILNKHLDKVRIFPLAAEWYETGNKKDLLNASEIVLSQIGNYKGLPDFINEYDPSDVISTPSVTGLISQSQKVDAKNLKGLVCISQSAKIKADQAFENVVCFEDQIIKHD